MKIETPLEYMLALEWEYDDLSHAEEFLKEWDKRDVKFYEKYKKIHRDFDQVEREHYRNCVNFWKTKHNEDSTTRNT